MFFLLRFRKLAHVYGVRPKAPQRVDARGVSMLGVNKSEQTILKKHMTKGIGEGVSHMHGVYTGFRGKGG